MAAEQKQNDDGLAERLNLTFNFKETSAKELEELAKLAETSERYEDMVVFMKQLVDKKLAELKNATDEVLVEKKHVLSTENRNLFSVAYKNVVGSRRSSWRHVNEMAETQAEEGDETDATKSLRAKYQAKVADEIRDSCLEIQDTLQQLAEASELIDKAVMKAGKVTDSKNRDNDNHIFYLKMRGDYFRYLREAFKTNDTYKAQCLANYDAAWKEAEITLQPTNPTRLGLALNFSVCHYEIMDDHKAACKLAKEAFDMAIEKLDSLNDSSYKDSTLIMQLLRDNLTIWSSNTDDIVGGDGPNAVGD